LGDIPKVTPSSKVVGDLAQFMVAQNLDTNTILEQADTLTFPDSVVNYLRGDIGIPPGGFPEPLRTKVLQGRGLTPIEGRPGSFLAAYNFTKSYEFLCQKFGERNVNEKDVLSYALYPQVFTDFKEYQALFGEVGNLPTNVFLHPLKVGEEVTITLEPGKDLIVQLLAIDALQEDGTRNVIFKVNGEDWYMPVTDMSAESITTLREKATGPNQVGSPMPGVVVGLKVHAGDEVAEGESVATLSAMKMETSIPATVSGTVKRVVVNVGDKVEGDDLILEIE
jgi:pyruvate carboxylase